MYVFKSTDFGLALALQGAFAALTFAQVQVRAVAPGAPGLTLGLGPAYGAFDLTLEGGAQAPALPTGRAALAAGTTPWALLALVEATGVAALAPGTPNPVLAFEFYAATASVTATVAGAADLATVTFNAPGTTPLISATRTGGGGTVTFASLAALAAYAGASLPTVLGWIGTAPGASWRP